MPDNDRAMNGNFGQRSPQQGCLRVRGPDPSARAIAMAEAGPVERDYPVVFCQQIDKPAQREIASHRAISVQKDHRWAFTPIDVVQANTINLKAFAVRRVSALSSAGKSIVGRGERNGGGDEPDPRWASRLHTAPLTERPSVANGRCHRLGDPVSGASQRTRTHIVP